MLTVDDIQKKVNAYPKNKPAKELLNELWLMYRIKEGLQEANEGKGIPLDEFKKDMEAWWTLK